MIVLINVTFDCDFTKKDFEKLKRYLEIKKIVEVICTEHCAATFGLDKSEVFQGLLDEKYSLKAELISMLSVRLELLSIDDLIKIIDKEN